VTIEQVKHYICLRMLDINASLEGKTPYEKHTHFAESVRELDTLEWVLDMLSDDGCDYFGDENE
jgi:hypothetical protein